MVAQMPPIRLQSFVSFYDFPVEHWVHLRTTNPSGVGVQRCEVEDGRHSTNEEARQRIVPVFRFAEAE